MQACPKWLSLEPSYCLVADTRIDSPACMRADSVMESKLEGTAWWGQNYDVVNVGVGTLIGLNTNVCVWEAIHLRTCGVHGCKPSTVCTVIQVTYFGRSWSTFHWSLNRSYYSGSNNFVSAGTRCGWILPNKFQDNQAFWWFEQFTSCPIEYSFEI